MSEIHNTMISLASVPRLHPTVEWNLCAKTSRRRARHEKVKYYSAPGTISSFNILHSQTHIMPANTILIEGSFEELCTELTQYIDQTNKTTGQESNLEADVEPLLKEDKKEDALKKVITASPALNNAPERGMTGMDRNGQERGLTHVKNSLLHTTFSFTS